MRWRGFLILGSCLVAVALGAWYLFSPQTELKPSSGQQVRVAAAADLKFVMEDLLTGFREGNPGVDVQVTYGASGTFYAQLTQKAPFDLFLSADIDYPRKLIDQGLADPHSEFTYALGHLVLWAPRSLPIDVQKQGMNTLLDARVRKIAIANPRLAPYGRAAQSAMKKLGVYDQVKDRLILGENVTQAAQFVQSGAADVGLLPLSLALAPVFRDQGRYWEVPLDAYPRLEQGGVILTWARDREATELFRSYLLSEAGKTVLKKFGFVLPEA